MRVNPIPARNPDDLAEKLLGDPSKLDVDHPAVRAFSLGYDEAMKDIEVVNIVRMMTVRTRFIDERWSADRRRCDAGGDSRRGVRFARVSMSGAAGHVRVFEVDRP